MFTCRRKEPPPSGHAFNKEWDIAPPTEPEVTFCELLVEALIGEEMRLDRVGYMEYRMVNDVSTIETPMPISRLKKHFALVLSPTVSAH